MASPERIQRRRRRRALRSIADWTTLGLAVCAMGIAAATWWRGTRGGDQPASGLRIDRLVDAWEELRSAGWHSGSPDGRVSVVVFGDYECPFCRGFEKVLSDALMRYPDDLFVIYRHFPLGNHPNAHRAARFAECGGEQGQFHAVHQLLYTAVTLEGLGAAVVAESAGIVDAERFIECSGAVRSASRVDADVAVGKEVGIVGVPAVIVNGVLLATPPDSARLDNLIKERTGA